MAQYFSWDEILEDENECNYCNGEGWIHDCGEDVCPCLNPDEADLILCPQCGEWNFNEVNHG